MNLKEAVELVNTYNRPDGRTIVDIVSCRECGNEFASQTQDIGRAILGRICSSVLCQQRANRKGKEQRRLIRNTFGGKTVLRAQSHDTRSLEVQNIPV